MRGEEQFQKVYFLGIGGIGMSALARWFRHEGLSVAGYDRTPSRLTEELSEEGITVHYDDLGAGVKLIAGEPQTTLVVVTPAVPADHGEWNWLSENGFTIVKRSKVLGMICNPHRCMAIAGTHGKTTVSTMAAVILKNSHIGCGAFLGGISKNFDSNIVLPGPDDQWRVTEADEYDRSFLALTPDVAVITFMDADHLDIYGKHEALEDSFLQFAGNIKKGGSLIVRKELEPRFRNLSGIGLYTYTLDGDALFSATSLSVDPVSKGYRFRINTPGGTTPLIRMSYPGLHNVENAVAAAGAAYLAGARPEEIAEGLEKYSGVRRRFDVMLQTKKCLFIDDYAHHPKELTAFITSVRLLHPGKKITGIFQPHLYTRTRDFATDFARSLDLLDMAILLPVYPAREQPIPGVSSLMVLDLMTIRERRIAEKAEILPLIREINPEILLTMGAGDIELMTDEITALLKNEEDR